jgi:hypothetical protein
MPLQLCKCHTARYRKGDASGPGSKFQCAGGLGCYFSMNIMVDWIREKHGNQMNQLFF